MPKPPLPGLTPVPHWERVGTTCVGQLAVMRARDLGDPQAGDLARLPGRIVCVVGFRSLLWALVAPARRRVGDPAVWLVRVEALERGLRLVHG